MSNPLPLTFQSTDADDLTPEEIECITTLRDTHRTLAYIRNNYFERRTLGDMERRWRDYSPMPVGGHAMQQAIPAQQPMRPPIVFYSRGTEPFTLVEDNEITQLGMQRVGFDVIQRNHFPNRTIETIRDRYHQLNPREADKLFLETYDLSLFTKCGPCFAEGARCEAQPPYNKDRPCPRCPPRRRICAQVLRETVLAPKYIKRAMNCIGERSRGLALASRACERCKRFKQKCSRQLPKCASCGNQQVCDYGNETVHGAEQQQQHAPDNMLLAAPPHRMGGHTPIAGPSGTYSPPRQSQQLGSQHPMPRVSLPGEPIMSDSIIGATAPAPRAGGRHPTPPRPLPHSRRNTIGHPPTSQERITLGPERSSPLQEQQAYREGSYGSHSDSSHQEGHGTLRGSRGHERASGHESRRGIFSRRSSASSAEHSGDNHSRRGSAGSGNITMAELGPALTQTTGPARSATAHNRRSARISGSHQKRVSEDHGHMASGSKRRRGGGKT